MKLTAVQISVLRQCSIPVNCRMKNITIKCSDTLATLHGLRLICWNDREPVLSDAGVIVVDLLEKNIQESLQSKSQKIEYISYGGNYLILRKCCVSR
jgi:hypothetical protein